VAVGKKRFSLCNRRRQAPDELEMDPCVFFRLISVGLMKERVPLGLGLGGACVSCVQKMDMARD